MAAKKKAAPQALPADDYSTFLKTMDTKYGIGVLRLADNGVYEKCDIIPTGVPSLNIALGVGGWPRGRVIELIGKESSGKSTLAYCSIAKAQRLQLRCALVDVEHTADTEYLESLGIDCSKLLIARPTYAEAALEMIMDFFELGIDVVVLDSISQLIPKAEMEGTMEDQQVGLLPRIMSKFLRKVIPVISDKKGLLIGINQLRDVIGSPVPMTRGSGGRGWRHAASVRVELRSTGKDKRASLKLDDEGVAGEQIEAVTKKNKVAPPNRKANFTIVYGQGPRADVDLVDLAIAAGVIIGTGVGHYRFVWPSMMGRKSYDEKEKKDFPELGSGMGNICQNMNVSLRNILGEKQKRLIPIAQEHGVDLDRHLSSLLYMYVVERRNPIARERLLDAFINIAIAAEEKEDVEGTKRLARRTATAASTTGESDDGHCPEDAEAGAVCADDNAEDEPATELG